MVDSKQQWKAWLYLLPALILLLIFTVWPIANTLFMAFDNRYASTFEEGESFIIGFKNFVDVFTDRANLFGEALKNTMLLCVLTVPVSTMLALLIAVALNSIKPLQKLFQTIFFLPYVTNTIAIGMVFTVMFEALPGPKAADGTQTYVTIGVINSILSEVWSWFGAEFKMIDWIGNNSSYWSTFFVIAIYIIWNALPFKILVLLGGLQGINKQYYEAAKVDGTSRFRTFWRITVPLVSPMLAYVIITGFIGGFKEYNSVVGILGEDMIAGTTGQEGAGSFQTVVGLVYDYVGNDNYGFACAASLVLFLIIFAVTMVNLYVSKKKVHY